MFCEIEWEEGYGEAHMKTTFEWNIYILQYDS